MPDDLTAIVRLEKPFRPVELINAALSVVETGTRNRLIHVNRENVRGNVLNVVNERSDEVFSILSSAKAMRFKALGRDRDDGDVIRLTG